MVVAAHKAGPTIAVMTARLGIGPSQIRRYLAEARGATGLPLTIHRVARPPREQRPAAEDHAGTIAAHAAGPILAEMTGCLGITADRVRRKLDAARAATGQALPLHRSATRGPTPKSDQSDNDNHAADFLQPRSLISAALSRCDEPDAEHEATQDDEDHRVTPMKGFSHR